MPIGIPTKQQQQQPGERDAARTVVKPQPVAVPTYLVRHHAPAVPTAWAVVPQTATSLPTADSPKAPNRPLVTAVASPAVTVIEQAPPRFERPRARSPEQRLRDVRRAALRAKLPHVCKRMQTAAYAKGGLNWDKTFQRVDKSGAGALQLDDFRTVIRRELRMTHAEVSDPDINMLFKQMDLNRNGEVDSKEIAAFIARHTAEVSDAKSAAPSVLLDKLARIRGQVQAACRNRGGVDWTKLFQRYDRSGDGALQIAEFRSLLRRELFLGPSDLSDMDVRAMFEHLDKSSSGSIGAKDLLAFFSEQPLVDTSKLDARRKSPSPQRVPQVQPGVLPDGNAQTGAQIRVAPHAVVAGTQVDVAHTAEHWRRRSPSRDSETDTSPPRPSSGHRLQWGQAIAATAPAAVDARSCGKGHALVQTSGVDKFEVLGQGVAPVSHAKDPGPHVAHSSIQKERALLAAERAQAAELTKQLEQQLALAEAASLSSKAARNSTQNVAVGSTHKADCVVLLNVGGEKIIEVLLCTLRLFEGSRLERLFAEGWEQRIPRDNADRVFIDHSADVFVPLVDFLRECRFVKDIQPDGILRKQDIPPLPTFPTVEQAQAFSRALHYFGLHEFLAVGAAKVACTEGAGSADTKPSGGRGCLQDMLDVGSRDTGTPGSRDAVRRRAAAGDDDDSEMSPSGLDASPDAQASTVAPSSLAASPVRTVEPSVLAAPAVGIDATTAVVSCARTAPAAAAAAMAAVAAKAAETGESTAVAAAAAAAAVPAAKPQDIALSSERFDDSPESRNHAVGAGHDCAEPLVLPLHVARGGLPSGSVPRGKPVAVERGGHRPGGGSSGGGGGFGGGGSSSGSARSEHEADPTKTAKGAAVDSLGAVGTLRLPDQAPHVNSSEIAAAEGLPDYHGWDKFAEGFF